MSVSGLSAAGSDLLLYGFQDPAYTAYIAEEAEKAEMGPMSISTPSTEAVSPKKEQLMSSSYSGVNAEANRYEGTGITISTMSSSGLKDLEEEKMGHPTNEPQLFEQTQRSLTNSLLVSNEIPQITASTQSVTGNIRDNPQRELSPATLHPLQDVSLLNTEEALKDSAGRPELGYDVFPRSKRRPRSTSLTSNTDSATISSTEQTKKDIAKSKDTMVRSGSKTLLQAISSAPKDVASSLRYWCFLLFLRARYYQFHPVEIVNETLSGFFFACRMFTLVLGYSLVSGLSLESSLFVTMSIFVVRLFFGASKITTLACPLLILGTLLSSESTSFAMKAMETTGYTPFSWFSVGEMARMEEIIDLDELTLHPDVEGERSRMEFSLHSSAFPSLNTLHVRHGSLPDEVFGDSDSMTRNFRTSSTNASGAVSHASVASNQPTFASLGYSATIMAREDPGNGTTSSSTQSLGSENPVLLTFLALKSHFITACLLVCALLQLLLVFRPKILQILDSLIPTSFYPGFFHGCIAVVIAHLSKVLFVCQTTDHNHNAASRGVLASFLRCEKDSVALFFSLPGRPATASSVMAWNCIAVLFIIIVVNVIVNFPKLFRLCKHSEDLQEERMENSESNANDTDSKMKTTKIRGKSILETNSPRLDNLGYSLPLIAPILGLITCGLLFPIILSLFSTIQSSDIYSAYDVLSGSKQLLGLFQPKTEAMTLVSDVIASESLEAIQTAGSLSSDFGSTFSFSFAPILAIFQYFWVHMAQFSASWYSNAWFLADIVRVGSVVALESTISHLTGLSYLSQATSIRGSKAPLINTECACKRCEDSFYQLSRWMYPVSGLKGPQSSLDVTVSPSETEEASSRKAHSDSVSVLDNSSSSATRDHLGVTSSPYRPLRAETSWTTPNVHAASLRRNIGLSSIIHFVSALTGGIAACGGLPKENGYNAQLYITHKGRQSLMNFAAFAFLAGFISLFFISSGSSLPGKRDTLSVANFLLHQIPAALLVGLVLHFCFNKLWWASIRSIWRKKDLGLRLEHWVTIICMTFLGFFSTFSVCLLVGLLLSGAFSLFRMTKNQKGFQLSVIKSAEIVSFSSKQFSFQGHTNFYQNCQVDGSSRKEMDSSSTCVRHESFQNQPSLSPGNDFSATSKSNPSHGYDYHPQVFCLSNVYSLTGLFDKTTFLETFQSAVDADDLGHSCQSHPSSIGKTPIPVIIDTKHFLFHETWTVGEALIDPVNLSPQSTDQNEKSLKGGLNEVETVVDGDNESNNAVINAPTLSSEEGTSSSNNILIEEQSTEDFITCMCELLQQYQQYNIDVVIRNFPLQFPAKTRTNTNANANANANANTNAISQKRTSWLQGDILSYNPFLQRCFLLFPEVKIEITPTFVWFHFSAYYCRISQQIEQYPPLDTTSDPISRSTEKEDSYIELQQSPLSNKNIPNTTNSNPTTTNKKYLFFSKKKNDLQKEIEMKNYR